MKASELDKLVDDNQEDILTYFDTSKIKEKEPWLLHIFLLQEDQIIYQQKSHTHGRTFKSDNLVKLPIKNNEISGEKILKFNRSRQNLGLPGDGAV